MDVVSVLSAATATIAAILAGLNLYLTGRREESRWVRDVLLEALEVFLGASFEGASAARQLNRDVPQEEISELELTIKRNHDLQMRTLTRLRVLASRETVHAASELHRSDHEFIDFLLNHRGVDPPTEQLETARARAHARREEFVRAARRQLQVDGPTARVENV
jgi:hypothetical protein